MKTHGMEENEGRAYGRNVGEKSRVLKYKEKMETGKIQKRKHRRRNDIEDIAEISSRKR